MDEDYLYGLHINELFALMVKTMNELLALDKTKENQLAIKEKHEQVELIQRVFIIRRGDTPPRLVNFLSPNFKLYHYRNSNSALC